MKMIKQKFVMVHPGPYKGVRESNLQKSPYRRYSKKIHSKSLGSEISCNMPSDCHMLSELFDENDALKTLQVLMLGNTTVPDLKEYSQSAKSCEFTGHIVCIKTALRIVCELKACESVSFFLNQGQLPILENEDSNSFKDIVPCNKVTFLMVVLNINPDDSKDLVDILNCQLNTLFENAVKVFPNISKLIVDIPESGVHFDMLKKHIGMWDQIKDKYEPQIRNGKTFIADKKVIPKQKRPVEKTTKDIQPKPINNNSSPPGVVGGNQLKNSPKPPQNKQPDEKTTTKDIDIQPSKFPENNKRNSVESHPIKDIDEPPKQKQRYEKVQSDTRPWPTVIINPPQQEVFHVGSAKKFQDIHKRIAHRPKPSEVVGQPQVQNTFHPICKPSEIIPVQNNFHPNRSQYNPNLDNPFTRALHNPHDVKPFQIEHADYKPDLRSHSTPWNCNDQQPIFGHGPNMTNTDQNSHQRVYDKHELSGRNPSPPRLLKDTITNSPEGSSNKKYPEQINEDSLYDYGSMTDDEDEESPVIAPPEEFNKMFERRSRPSSEDNGPKQSDSSQQSSTGPIRLDILFAAQEKQKNSYR